jgi:hypothetical protein
MKYTRIYALAIFGLTLGSCGTAQEKKDQTAGQLFPKGKLVTNSNRVLPGAGKNKNGGAQRRYY